MYRIIYLITKMSTIFYFNSLNRSTVPPLNSASPFNTPSLALPPTTGPTLTPTVSSSAPSSLVYNKPPLWAPMG